jgi:hypothetical protein
VGWLAPRTQRRVRNGIARGLGGAACPAPGSPRPRSVAGEGRAFGACCFAGKLRSPAPLTGGRPHPAGLGAATPTAIPTSIPTAFPAPPMAYPPHRLEAESLLVMPPHGEWCGQAERMRFARLIDRPVRILGGPAVRDACGGNLRLVCCLLSVALKEHPGAA